MTEWVSPLVDEAYRHWRLSDVMLNELDPLMAKVLGGSQVVRENLYAAVAGHHGGPPAREDARKRRRQLDQIGDDGFASASLFIEALVPLFPEASLFGLTEADSRLLSWLLSGITVQADWIGSNVQWFSFRSSDIPVTEYWHSNLDLAVGAIKAAGLNNSQVRADLTPGKLVGASQLRPMQAVCAEEVLPDGPCLALIEDSMGTGKTEAAIILAQRMIAARKAQGIYFALPTTATADSMFSRMRPMLGQLFEGRPSLSLAHGRRMLSDSFSEVRGKATSPVPPIGTDIGNIIEDATEGPVNPIESELVLDCLTCSRHTRVDRNFFRLRIVHVRFLHSQYGGSDGGMESKRNRSSRST